MRNEVIRTLESVVSIFERPGHWKQGGGGIPTRHRCLALMINDVARYRGKSLPTLGDGAALLEESWTAVASTIVGGSVRGDATSAVRIIANWNDEPGRTVAEVIGVLMRTIAHLRRDVPAELPAWVSFRAPQVGIDGDYEQVAAFTIA